jgi:ketosteroid isomerase-like protein
MSIQEINKELMKTLDNAWNSQDWETFSERHADNVAVFWPGQADPTRGVQNHREESIDFFKMFPENHLANDPYKILFAEGDYTCSVADFTGTFKGAMKGLDGKIFNLLTRNFIWSFVLLPTGRIEKF